jgi:hypothetical protein
MYERTHVCAHTGAHTHRVRTHICDRDRGRYRCGEREETRHPYVRLAHLPCKSGEAVLPSSMGSQTMS